ncbi:hypothetical protein Tco_1452407 [Tanacetum coccineum]
MIRTPYRHRVLVETPPVQEGPKSPRSILEVDPKEDPEEDPEEDPKEDPEEEEIESDLESTARSEAKPKELEDTCAIDNIILEIVTQVTNNVNNANANGGNGNGRNENGGNDECSYKANEMEKLETEFWNHTMVGANHAVYTDQFHELAKLVPHLVTLESKRIGRCIH